MKIKNSDESYLSAYETSTFEGTFFEKASFNGTFRETSTVPVTFSETSPFSLKVGEIVSTTAKDHTKLTNLDAPDQHPIEAVIGLNSALHSKIDKDSILTNEEIEELFGGFKLNG